MPKSQSKILPTFIICLFLLAGLTQAKNSTAPRAFAPVQAGIAPQAEVDLPYAPDRILVQFKRESVNQSIRSIPMRKGAGPSDNRMNLKSIDALAAAHGMVSIKRPYHSVKNRVLADEHGLDRWFMFRFKGSRHLPDVAAAFRADHNVEAVSLDWRVYPMSVPTDPLYKEQWGHDNTGQMQAYDLSSNSHENGVPVGTTGFDSNAEAAWRKSQGYGSSAVTIAIIDSGVDMEHPDLNLLQGYDFGDDDSNPDDDSLKSGHGTTCAGVAAGIANGIGVAGIAGGVRILPCKVASSDGTMYFSAVRDALYWAADQGADVISMSLGAPVFSDPATDAALKYAYEKGCLLLGATGNENDSNISYPAFHVNVMAIGAASPCGNRKRSSSDPSQVNPGIYTDTKGVTCDNEVWWGSSYGTAIPDDRGAVDLLAPTIMPTTDIVGAGGYSTDSYTMWFNGTSCSTPYAAGVAALVISSNPELTNDEVWMAMTSTATDIVNDIESGIGWDRYSGYGMVNADAAIGGSGSSLPISNFSGSPTSGASPLTVSFMDLSTGGPTSWLWDFGDDGSSTEQNPEHTYYSPGDYEVSLTSTNAEGSVIRTKANYINVGGEFVTASGETRALGEVEGSYIYTKENDDQYEFIKEEVINIRKKQTTAIEHSWHFDLPSGEAIFHMAAGRTLTSEEEGFFFEYTMDDTNYTPLVTIENETVFNYTIPVGQVSGEITIRVTDTNRRFGVIDYDELFVYWMAFEVQGVGPVAPIADFTATPTSGDESLTVSFTDLSSGNPTSWLWDFGDGSSSTRQNPSHVYNQSGTYSVSLIATNDLGSDQIIKTDYISVKEPGAEPTEMVASMIVTGANAGPNYFGVCDILVLDEFGFPVDGAFVTVSYSGPTGGVISDTTTNGTVTLRSTKAKRPSENWCFTVVDIILDPLEYYPDFEEVCE